MKYSLFIICVCVEIIGVEKWCHLLAIDAIYFKDPSKTVQYGLYEEGITQSLYGFSTLLQEDLNMNLVLLLEVGVCGAFNGDRQLKGTS